MSSHYSLSNNVKLEQKIIAMRVNLIPSQFPQAVQVIGMFHQSALAAHEGLVLSAEVLHISVFVLVAQDQERLRVLEGKCKLLVEDAFILGDFEDLVVKGTDQLVLLGFC